MNPGLPLRQQFLLFSGWSIQPAYTEVVSSIPSWNSEMFSSSVCQATIIDIIHSRVYSFLCFCLFVAIIYFTFSYRVICCTSGCIIHFIIWLSNEQYSASGNDNYCPHKVPSLRFSSQNNFSFSVCLLT